MESVAITVAHVFIHGPPMILYSGILQTQLAGVKQKVPRTALIILEAAQTVMAAIHPTLTIQPIATPGVTHVPRTLTVIAALSVAARPASGAGRATTLLNGALRTRGAAARLTTSCQTLFLRICSSGATIAPL